MQIEYDVELYGAEKKVQLPFVMGVMSDLSGVNLSEADMSHTNLSGTNLSGAERTIEVDEHVVPLAGSVCECLACDIDLKLHGGAISIAGFQMAAPRRFRWRAQPPRR